MPAVVYVSGKKFFDGIVSVDDKLHTLWQTTCKQAYQVQQNSNTWELARSEERLKQCAI